MTLRDCSDVSFLDECLRQIARGEQGALRSLYDETRRPLFGLAYHLMSAPEAAEDLLQEAYLTIWRKAHLYDSRLGEPLAWLKCIVRNKAIDALRQRRRAQTDELSEAMGVADTANPSLIEGLSAGLSLGRCFEGLSQRNARVVRSIYFEGLTYAELAAREAVPLATAKSWVRRSLQQMRETLEPVDGPTARTAPAKKLAAVLSEV